jgi:diguanylate cyclase (GGDEF)-like protein
VFESSEALNACPKLRDRPNGSCSAACVPVGFMGRALGVLHVTGPEGEPPSADAVDRLTTLATQAGARIGTVRAFERSQLQAATDVITGLANRRAAQTHLRRLMKGTEQFALVIADLDQFKRLNDKHGHDAGDRALRQFAQVCQSVLRGRDIVGRWGGEEFVIVLPGLDSHGAMPVLERLRQRLTESHTEGNPSFTASFGVADSSEAETMEQLVQIADAALYASKAAGRDRITIGMPPLELPSLSEDLSDIDADLAERPYLPGTGVALHEAADEEEPAPNGVEIR